MNNMLYGECDGGYRYHEPLFSALKACGLTEVYFFTSYTLSDIAKNVEDEPIGAPSRLKLKRHLESQQFSVLGVGTLLDSIYQQGFGAYYRTVIEPYERLVLEGSDILESKEASEFQKHCADEQVLCKVSDDKELSEKGNLYQYAVNELSKAYPDEAFGYIVIDDRKTYLESVNRIHEQKKYSHGLMLVQAKPFTSILDYQKPLSDFIRDSTVIVQGIHSLTQCSITQNDWIIEQQWLLERLHRCHASQKHQWAAPGIVSQMTPTETCSPHWIAALGDQFQDFLKRTKEATTIPQTQPFMLQAGTDLEAYDEEGTTALGRAIHFGEWKTVRLLLLLGAGQRLGLENAERLRQEYAHREPALWQDFLNRNRAYKWKLTLFSITQKEKTPEGLLVHCDSEIRYLCSNTYKQIFGDEFSIIKKNVYGQRASTVIRTEIALGVEAGLHIMQNPELPGREFMVYHLANILFGVITPPLSLWRLDKTISGFWRQTCIQYPILASQTIEGQMTLHDALEFHPECIAQIDRQSFSEAIILAILIKPENGTADNYRLEPHYVGKKLSYRLISIDNSHAFMTPLDFTRDGTEILRSQGLQVKTILYCLDLMREPLNCVVREQLLNLNAYDAIKTWLITLQQEQKKINFLFDKAKESLQKNNVDINILFSPSLITSLYNRILDLQTIVQQGSAPSILDLLKALHPELGQRYGRFFKTTATAQQRFERLIEAYFRNDCILHNQGQATLVVETALQKAGFLEREIQTTGQGGTLVMPSGPEKALEQLEMMRRTRKTYINSKLPSTHPSVSTNAIQDPTNPVYFSYSNLQKQGLTVNEDYQYEDNDIQAILSTRIRQIFQERPERLLKPIQLLAAADNILGSQLKTRLEQARGIHQRERIVLIPYNLGNAHWVGILLEFDANEHIQRAQYFDSLSYSTHLPENIARELREVYPVDLKASVLLSQTDYTSCGAYMIENLLLAILNEHPPIVSANDIRALHLEALKQHNPYFYKKFYMRQQANRSSTDDLKIQLGYVEKLKNVRFSKTELSRILALKHILAKMSDEIRMPLLEAFTYKSDYGDNHVLHLDIIRAALIQAVIHINTKEDKEHQLLYAELIRLLFDMDWKLGTVPAIETPKLQVSYNEILAMTQSNILSPQLTELQGRLKEAILKDEQFAQKLQAELWDDLLEHDTKLKCECSHICLNTQIINRH
jgi:hypothetical protein